MLKIKLDFTFLEIRFVDTTIYPAYNLSRASVVEGKYDKLLAFIGLEVVR